MNSIEIFIVIFGLIFGAMISIVGFAAGKKKVGLCGALICLGALIYACFGMPSRDYPKGNPVGYIIGGIISISGVIALLINNLPKKIIAIFGIILFIIGCFYTISELSKSSVGDNRSIYECASCGKKYYSGDAGGNAWSIVTSNMCKRCLKNYETVKEAVDYYTLNK